MMELTNKGEVAYSPVLQVSYINYKLFRLGTDEEEEENKEKETEPPKRVWKADVAEKWGHDKFMVGSNVYFVVHNVEYASKRIHFELKPCTKTFQLVT